MPDQSTGRVLGEVWVAGDDIAGQSRMGAVCGTAPFDRYDADSASYSRASCWGWQQRAWGWTAKERTAPWP
jgi:hypothetical protein